MLRIVMPAVVPTTSEQPWQYWLRFEEGSSGNPHGHGVGFSANNPSLETIAEQYRACAKQAGNETGAAAEKRSESFEETASSLANYFSPLVSEWHPAKNAGGEAL
jgi:hypothetical protein